ncbi:hypothetical protein C8R46DRAFT_1344216 [Mycena filopes]|nr:hypothetical protein C8R46DRAFT_1344216 [Mycena filopes]
MVAGLEDGSGPSAAAGGTKTDLFLAVVEKISGHADDRWCPAFIHGCFEGVWAALTATCEALAVAHGPPVAAVDRKATVYRLATHLRG